MLAAGARCCSLILSRRSLRAGDLQRPRRDVDGNDLLERAIGEQFADQHDPRRSRGRPTVALRTQRTAASTAPAPLFGQRHRPVRPSSADRAVHRVVECPRLGVVDLGQPSQRGLASARAGGRDSAG